MGHELMSVFFRYSSMFALSTATEIIGQMCRDAEQVIPSMRLTVVTPAGSQESVIRLLKQIVCDLGIGRSTPQKYPQRTCCAIVKRSKRVVIHLQSFVGVTSGRP